MQIKDFSAIVCLYSEHTEKQQWSIERDCAEGAIARAKSLWATLSGTGVKNVP